MLGEKRTLPNSAEHAEQRKKHANSYLSLFFCSCGNAGDGSRGVAGGGAYTIFAVILAACATRGLAASAVGVGGTRLATRPSDGVSLSAYAWRPRGFTGAGSNGERLAGVLRSNAYGDPGAGCAGASAVQLDGK